MADFELKYVGPGPEALEVAGEPVALGATVSVDEDEADRLLSNGAWELVGRRKPKARPAPVEVAVAVLAGDVHAAPAEAAEVVDEGGGPPKDGD